MSHVLHGAGPCLLHRVCEPVQPRCVWAEHVVGAPAEPHARIVRGFAQDF